jgi:hypothetical protein
MLKKGIATAILLLMVVSFTIGSVSPVDSTADMKRFPGGFHKDMIYTQVFLDMTVNTAGSGFGVRAMPPTEMMPEGPVFAFRPGHDEFIEGKMMVIPAGQDMPRLFPVFFFKHQGPVGSDRVHYIADTAFDVDGAQLSFKGEVQLLSDTVVTGEIADIYNNEIMPGETNWHQAYVSGSPATFNFELKWNNSDDALRVVVYTPDGNELGPYYDDSDGVTDGCINMEISNPDGVANGAWSFKVTDTGVTGKDEYYLKTW